MKDKITVFLFLAYIFTFSFLHIIIQDKEISESERRILKTLPSFKLSNEYIEDIEDYLLDQFPYRDTFRSIKANFNYNILLKLDNNDIYIKDNYIYKSDYPTNKKSIEYFKNNINKISQLLTENNNTYLMIIPDKNYYLDSNTFLHIDYDYIYKEIDLLDMKTIDIRNIMNINDYYETDTHWKQENLEKVVYELSKYMKFDYQKYNYQQNKYNNFYGVYYGESAIKRKGETLCYLTNDIINQAKVYYLENNLLDTVYNIENLNSLDAYEIYLDGASSYIEIINNNNNKTNKELIIFRDSFASSISPLLIPYYSKITLIDNRYINSENFLNYVEFNNQDVLFMYSTLVVNNSTSLKG